MGDFFKNKKESVDFFLPKPAQEVSMTKIRVLVVAAGMLIQASLYYTHALAE